MMVVFVSECEKNALKKTRRVLDSFANRIGNNVWQTVITLEGLDAVKKLLRKNASKSTAVACHWLRSRSRAELYWVVGNRHKFNNQGQVPVHRTEQNILNMQWENDWRYLPLIKALTALAALLHDWGKTNMHFQQKLKDKNKNISDPLRHEWVSYLLLNALIGKDTQDREWLAKLAAGKINTEKITERVCGNSEPRTNLPPVAQLLSWLIITHHRLPFFQKKKQAEEYSGNNFDDFGKLFTIVKENWGYRNEQAELEFKHGILAEAQQWLRQVCKWANKMIECLYLAEDCLKDGSWRVVLHHARLAMMLGDHYYSSLGRNDKDSLSAKGKWQSELHANTQGQPKGLNIKPRMKQPLDEHLVGVMTEALPIVCLLPKVETFFPSLSNDKSHKLQKRSVGKYRWQDKAVDKISNWQQQDTNNKQRAVFVVNMASTGTGKTFANAKVMRALAGDDLRYVLALGLRTLTLQTGDEYRQRIGLGKDEMAVVIGSQAVVELHEGQDNKRTLQEQELEEHIKEGSESQEELWDSELDGENFIEEEFSKKLLKGKHREKHKNFLYAPILVCTIDHIMAATETRRGGRYILPSLRLLSSELVIDEIDDFSSSDMIAIGRLIHLAGMLGRKVMISSATIPPDLAEGYFNAYQAGWQLFAQTRAYAARVLDCVWIDEHDTKIERLAGTADVCRENYRQTHSAFVKKRVARLHTHAVRRRGEIVTCTDVKDREDDKDSKRTAYYERIKATALELHARHSTVDSKTKKSVSFGVVRVANIDPCIELSKYMLTTTWPSNTDVKVMAYHSRQVMLLRSEQEKHLDAVLKVRDRHESFSNAIVRQHLDSSKAKDVLFIVVATPVEEVGRDHDFDWAVVEPSSFRSIIQLAGRVRRHREDGVATANVALLQYNLKGLQNKNDKPVFRHPGFEGSGSNKLTTHDLQQLLDTNKIAECIDATARIVKPETLQPQAKLADLEHKVIAEALTCYNAVGPEALQGYLSHCWGMTALPQILNPFREGANNINLHLIYNEGDIYFAEKNREGNHVEREGVYRIEHDKCKFPSNKLWLPRNYRDALANIAEQKSITREQASLRYGELSLPLYLQIWDNEFIYSDQLGLGKK